MKSVNYKDRDVLVNEEVMRELDLVEDQAVDDATYSLILDKMLALAKALAQKPKH